MKQRRDRQQWQFETYKLHAELAERVASLREGVNKLYSGMVSGIVAASVALHRIDSDAGTAWVLAVLGIVVSFAWLLSIRSVSGRLVAKGEVLRTMERNLPFRFLTHEKCKFEQQGFLKRESSLTAVPYLFLGICVLWLTVLWWRACPWILIFWWLAWKALATHWLFSRICGPDRAGEDLQVSDARGVRRLRRT